MAAPPAPRTEAVGITIAAMPTATQVGQQLVASVSTQVIHQELHPRMTAALMRTTWSVSRHWKAP